MIKIDQVLLEIEHFPDGTPRINFDLYEHFGEARFNRSEIMWKYEDDSELFYMMLIKKHVDRYTAGNPQITLYLPYIPNARMDRVKNHDEIFTLKYFCDFINWLDFDCVYVLDPHSDVSTALINNCMWQNVREYISFAINEIPDDIILYFPDAGAAKRYSDLFPDFKYCYGEKNRDWSTGEILGLDIRANGIDLTGKTVLMIDDIISYGGSLHYSALELKKNGVRKIYAYASHTENSILDREKGTLIKDLENNTVERLFTTDSIFTGTHDKITVMEV